MTVQLGNIGPLIRLWGIKSDQLPSGPLAKVGGEGAEGTNDNSGENTGNTNARGSSSNEELTNLLGSLLKEAVPFVDDVAPKNILGGGDEKIKIKKWKSKGSKSYNNDTIKVDLFERVIPAKEPEAAAATASSSSESGRPTPTAAMGGGETWICRRSIHEDKAQQGTASWDEFRECFKERHPETEALFTPSVMRMDKTVVWDCGGVPPQKISNETYANFTLCILEARHRVGKPLKDRTFPILQMTCSAMDTGSTTTATGTTASTNKEKREFLVISVTIPDYFDSTSALPSASRHDDAQKGGKTEAERNTADKDKDTVIASYASIERIRQLDLNLDPNLSGSGSGSGPGQGEGKEGDGASSGKIEWLMALTSDARGILPRWVQNLALPGQIAKDVPLFLDWIGRERENNTK